MKAHEIIAKPAAWIHGAMFLWRDEVGNIDHTRSFDHDNCYCALGAIRKKHGVLRGEDWDHDPPEYKADVQKLADDLAKTVFGRSITLEEQEWAITDWNDFRAKDHAVVHAKLKELDI